VDVVLAKESLLVAAAGPPETRSTEIILLDASRSGGTDVILSEAKDLCIWFGKYIDSSLRLIA
jgi:hypothetical protein